MPTSTVPIASSPSAAAAPVSAPGVAVDRIQLMQTFVRIVEAGSLSAAAAQLGATQPTVSRRLQALERSLGTRLLSRSTHAMKLTEDGERCFARAKELIAAWDSFESDLRGAGAEPEGTLRVVAPHAFGQNVLVRPLADYLHRYPRMSVDWLLHDRAPDFIADAVDCAIHVGEVSDPQWVAIKLAEVPRIVVAAPSVLGDGPAPSHAKELAALPWLALRSFYRTDITLTHVQSGERHSVPITPRLSTDSLYATCNATLLGLGVSVVSAWAVADDLAAGRLVHLTPQWHASPLPMHLVYPYARHYPAKLRRFVEAMRESVPGAVSTGLSTGS
ncbi:LysR family transcriptional regulator [Variovorax sp. ZT4R33]|uniref:LysR family transcriptional regulator n=1 Tax=Variovorax sp. ZT4R33 TaxID=3443743 RepID=UPI003F450DC3